MAAGRRENGKISTEKWRKHMHWFSLTRFHAEIVANDTDVNPQTCTRKRKKKLCQKICAYNPLDAQVNPLTAQNFTPPKMKGFYS